MALNEYYRNPENFLNVLYFDDDPEMAARMVCDLHVGKMLEAACRILSNAWHLENHLTNIMWGLDTGDAPHNAPKHLQATLAGNRIYGMQHPNHPCVDWVRLYGGNYSWLYRHGCALADEFFYRFKKSHPCHPTILALERTPPSLEETKNTWCDAPAVVPQECIIGEVAECYFRYYRKERPGLLKYTGRKPPKPIADIAHFQPFTE